MQMQEERVNMVDVRKELGVKSLRWQIDVLEAQVGELEGAVAQLDNYSRRLEGKFSSLLQP